MNMSSNESYKNHSLPIPNTNGTKKKKKRQQLLDADGSMENVQNDDDDDDNNNFDQVTTTTTPTATTATNVTPLTLPDGRLIDCKNTLYSFDAVAVDAPPPNPARMITPPRPPTNTTKMPLVVTPFTLMDGRLIDAKNTLQSFTTAAVLDRHSNNNNHINSNHQLPPNLTAKRMNQLFDVDGDDSTIDNNNDMNDNNYNENMNREYIKRVKLPPTTTARATIPTIEANGRNVTTTGPFTLPNGRPVDGKNTLQSIVVSDSRIIAAAAVKSKNAHHHHENVGSGAAITSASSNTTPSPYTLFDGRPIDGKNTLQSFAISDSRIIAAAAADLTTGTKNEQAVRTVPTGRSAMHDDDRITASTFDNGQTQQQQHTATGATDDDHTVNDCIVAAGVANVIDGIITSVNINSINHNNNSNYEPIFHTQAVPVQSLVVAEGELFDLGIQSQPPPPSEVKRRTVFWVAIVFAMLFVAGATGIGVYCGTGNCGSSSSSSTLSSSDNTPTTPTPTTDMRPATTTTALAPVVSSNEPVIIRPLNPTSSPVIPHVITPIQLPLPPTTPINDPSRNPSALSTMAPITEAWITDTPATTRPVVVPIPSPVAVGSPTSVNQQLRVACTFFNYTNLTKCRTMTSFDANLGDTTVGTTIPTEIGILTRLRYLELSSNQLTGTIPNSLGNLSQLHWLVLSFNQLNGTIPSTLGNLRQLNVLGLDSNQLTGTIPSTLGNLIQLTTLSLRDNQLNGTILSTLGSLTQLTFLGLSRNQLNSTIPSTFGNLIKLNYLGLWGNQLNGAIPSTLGINKLIIKLKHILLDICTII